MDSITIRGRIINRSDFVDSPESFGRVMIWEFANDDHYEVMKQFFKEWKAKMKAELMLSIGFQTEGFQERASNLFFAMRDQLCKHMGDTTRANKDAVYHALILDCEFRHLDGRIKQSIKELDKKELWLLVQRTQRELDETEHSYEYIANINDLRRDYASANG